MKILAIHNKYLYQGGENVVFEAECRLLRQDGHTVRRLIWDNEQIRSMLPPLVGARATWSIEAAREVRHAVDEFEPDLVHVHNFFPLVSPSVFHVCHGMGLPTVLTLHNYRLLCPVATHFRDGRVCEDCLGKKFAWPGVVHACYRDSRLASGAVAFMTAAHHLLGTWREKVDAYIALTRFGKKKFVEGGFPEERIHVKPNFLGFDPGVGQGERSHFLFVGRLSEEKGIETLLRATASVDEIPLKIVGQGPLRGSVVEAATQTGKRNVAYLGRVPRERVFDLLRGSSALLFPSEWYEGFPLVLLEAFACGTPVIASRLGAAQEIVEEGRTGLLFEPGNSEDLARRMSWAAAHPDQMRAMGRRAREEYEAYYKAMQNYDLLMKIYQGVIVG